VITEDKLRKALDIERELYTDDSGSARRRRNRVMACRWNWLVIVLIIAVALMLFLSDRIPLLFLLLVASLVANYLMRRSVRSNGPTRNERYGSYIY
jgi:FtsH-binding integral membrane protein